MKYLLYIAGMIVGLCGMTAIADDTTRKGPLRPRIAAVAQPSSDTLRIDGKAIAPDSLVITSYDKPLRSLRETFFVTNRYSSLHLASLSLQLTYRRADDSTMLHSRTVVIPASVPPGETRQLYTTSWDRQYSYFYHSTRIRPRSPKAVAYDVEIQMLGATFQH